MTILNFLGRRQVPAAAKVVPADAWLVIDEGGRPIYCAPWSDSCHAYINGAINVHGIETAHHWVVRRYVLAREEARA